ncbi:hypothetical protein BLL52_0127 [Rhodoferax antarcticus ANT.BR]|uniref:Uncharacterized protein n=1 Tax=Rhodoferax antarcticus ANT.BR TaxID=1111071 RepID=A0A1Q8YKU5_9BURK|nr:hypothetical protein BLL52_0127 [Rhodoferax antarcticus ANT.BR]
MLASHYASTNGPGKTPACAADEPKATIATADSWVKWLFMLSFF